MDQKRFLTAGEVFQLFGVGADALNALVESGDVSALADRGSFKYRSEDFLRLVQDGKLSPRTAGEMFLADSKGDIPFLKIKGEDQGMKFDDKVSFIELDEDALNDQAVQKATTAHTPATPESWFDDLSEPKNQSKSSDTMDEIDVSHSQAAKANQPTGNSQESDSDVKVVDDDAMIDFSEPDVAPSASDSDVRLEGPVSSTGLFAPQKQAGGESETRKTARPAGPSDSDSDVRFATSKSGRPDSDSDVRLATSKMTRPDSDSDVRISTAPSVKGDSDSDVRLARENAGRPGSDSDVRLAVAPVAKTDSDSDVRIAKSATGRPDSDSDVRIAKFTTGNADSDSDVKIAEPAGTAQRPDSDSDVTIVAPPTAAAEKSSSDSDSDVVIAASQPVEEAAAPARPSGPADSDSDVRITDGQGRQVPTPQKSFGDTSILLAAEDAEAFDLALKSPAKKPGELATDDSGIGIDLETSDSGTRRELIDSGTTFDFRGDDSGIPTTGEIAANEISVEPAAADVAGMEEDSGIAMESVHDSGIALESDASDSGISLESASSDSGIALDSAASDSGISLDSTTSDSGISLERDSDSGITLENAKTEKDIAVPSGDSGIALDSIHSDSGIALESSTSDSGISLESATSDSGIMLDDKRPDSGISLESAAAGDSGISIASGKTDSGISLMDGDSGIRMDTAGDSGIRMDSAGDSTVRYAKTDSDLAYEEQEEPIEASATLSDLEFEETGSDQTQTLPLSGEHRQDSGFDVSLAESDHTMEMALDSSEMALDGSDESSATVVHKGPKKVPKSSNLSESFDVDDSLEVEELDISEDLEGVPEAEYSGEFAEADEEVLEAGDDDFSSGAVSVADEEEESEERATVSKVRTGPREPAWGAVAVAPIICASVVMLVTVTVLWGGIATMWSGGEASGPAGMLISTLAGFI